VTIFNRSPADLVFEGGGRRQTLSVVRVPRARALRLTVDPRDAAVRLALPSRASLRNALDWAEGKRGWIEDELAKLPGPQPIAPGMRFLLGGEQITLDWSETAPRAPRRIEDRLVVGGSLDGLGPRLIRHLRRQAATTLSEETHRLAEAHGITIGRVGVGDPKSRWGSCAASGDIRYSWRLILAPEFVLRATVAHEVAHRIHMNHSAAFHACAAQLNGSDPTPARRWLRDNGAALHWFGRDG
jgi:predicted metal-dependent hydrolase